MGPDYIKLKDIKPALSGYVREALSLISISSVPDENVIHDVRVLMKKSRAVMILINNQVEDEIFNNEYLTFKLVGRKMSSRRDNSVHRKNLKDLKKEHPAIFSELKDNPRIESLLKKPEEQSPIHQDPGDEIDQIREMLHKSYYRIRFLTLSDINTEILLKELEKSYVNASEKYLAARNSLKPTDIHLFRKHAKDLLYQLWFFRPVNPPVIKSLEKKLDLLTQNLGKHHDMHQLVKSLEYKYSAQSVSPALDELIVIIRQKQDLYLSKVWPSAYKIFRPGRQLVSVMGFKILKI